MSFDRSLTRGPLPAAVYWRRRAAVLGMVVLLVIGISRMMGGGEAESQARPASAETTQVPVVPDHVGAPVETPGAEAPAAEAPIATDPAAPAPDPAAPTDPAAPVTELPQTPQPLPTPTGRCSDDDVNVSVAVGKAEATRTVPFTLTLKTNVDEACLWNLSSKSLQVRVTSGSDEVWTTLDCTKVIRSQTLTLRRDTPLDVLVKWNSRRSDDECTKRTQYARPGYYHVQVAALGGEPTDVQFRLRKAAPVAKKTTAPAPATQQPATPPNSEPTRLID